jgi:Domain of unknown function (DUF1906)
MIHALDAAGHPAPANVHSRGYNAMIQYLPSTNGMPDTYPVRCLAVGLPLISAWEITPQVGLGGATAGRADASTAINWAQRRRQPKGTCIYAAIDFEPVGTQMTEVQNYARAWTTALHAAGYLSGMYGGIGTINAVRGLCDKLWQTFAWSWTYAKGKEIVGTGLALYQGGSQVAIDTVVCNIDTIFSTPGAWTTDGPVNLFPPAPPKDPTMKWGIQDYDNALWAIIPGPTGLRRAHVATPADSAALQVMGAVPVAFTSATVASMPVITLEGNV